MWTTLGRQWRRTPGTTAVMNLVVWPLMALWTACGVAVAPFGIPGGMLVLRWPLVRAVHLAVWIYGRGWLAIMSLCVKFERVRFDTLPTTGAGIVTLNHLSAIDVYCLAMLPRHDVVFAVRAWPFRIPWYAPFMHMAQYIHTEAPTWEENLAACRKHVDAGRLLVFFPEGHRSRTGELQRLRSGAFRVAADTGVTIYPIHVSGTGAVLPPGSLKLRPGCVRMEALAPVDTKTLAAEGGHVALRSSVEKALQRAELSLT